ncbi:MAG: FecR domain-containing protein [Deltaproteobacteria bacterium]|nr:FecR domain-containing protein [Deltaproteobacteria bacterium]
MMAEPSRDDLDQRLRGALGHVRSLRPEWSRDRADRVKQRVAQRTVKTARPSLPFAVAFGALGVALGLACIALMRSSAPSTQHADKAEVDWGMSRAITSQPPAASASRVHPFEDGSFAEFLDWDESEIQLLESGPDRMIVKLDGSAVFDVAKHRARTFVVRWDGLSVEALGTRFRLATDGSVSHLVVVEDGTVKVTHEDRETVLVAGQERMFFALEPQDTKPSRLRRPRARPPRAELVHREPTRREPPRRKPTRGVSEAQASATMPSREGGPLIRSDDDWRKLGRAGQYEAAYAAFLKEGDPNALNTAEERFLFADISRFSGHPRAAVSALLPLAEEDSAESPGSSGADAAGAADDGGSASALAAFTLGRIYLEDLERPDDAAEAFHRVRVLAPSTVLAESALAREIEALAKSGRLDEARRYADVFVALYPESLHRSEVLRFTASEKR